MFNPVAARKQPAISPWCEAARIGSIPSLSGREVDSPPVPSSQERSVLPAQNISPRQSASNRRAAMGYASVAVQAQREDAEEEKLRLVSGSHEWLPLWSASDT
eukprot:6426500-Pyramimonas_sp.AAC.1